MRPSLRVCEMRPLLSLLYLRRMLQLNTEGRRVVTYCPGRARPGSIQLSPFGRRNDLGEKESLLLISSLIWDGRLEKLASDCTHWR